MTHSDLTHPEVVNALSGILALCDVTLTHIGNRSRSRQPLLMIRRAVGRLLHCRLADEAPPGLEGVYEQTVLVVDEDVLSLVMIEHELRTMGMVVVGAQDSAAALRLVDIVDGRIDRLIWTLHGHDEPPATARAFEEQGIRVVYLADTPARGMVQRPLEPRALREALCSMLKPSGRSQ